MRVICTGGFGFLGSHLVTALVEGGHTVTVLDNMSTGKESNLAHVKGKFKYVWWDLVSDYPQFLWKEMENADAVFHLAALPRVGKSIEKPFETHLNNVNATLQALLMAKYYKIPKFIYASSSSVYGDQNKLPLTEDMKPAPVNPYAYQKYMGELYCRMFPQVYGKMATFSMRFFNVYGSRMATEGQYRLVFGNWIDQIRQGQKLSIYGDGEQTRDFTHVSDVVSALMAVAEKKDYPFNNYTFNVCAGAQTSVNKLASLFGYETEHLDARGNEERFKQGDNRALNEFCGWEAKVSIEDGVKLLKEEYKV